MSRLARTSHVREKEELGLRMRYATPPICCAMAKLCNDRPGDIIGIPGETYFGHQYCMRGVSGIDTIFSNHAHFSVKTSSLITANVTTVTDTMETKRWKQQMATAVGPFTIILR